MPGLDNPAIEKFLTLSTAHIPYADAKWLDVYETGDQQNIIVYPKGDYGWFIYATGDFEPDQVPQALRDCLNKATEMGCVGVVLDGDAGTLDGLPTYDW